MEYFRKNWWVSALTIFLYFGFIVLVWYLISSFLVDKESIREIVSGYGIFSPLIFILIQITQNVVAPIAHQPLLMAGGFIFDPITGFFLNWIGTIIGTFLIVLITKKFGRPLVNKMVSEKIINKYDYFVKKISPFGLFLIYAIPFFPDDEITYLVGLSAMPLKSIVPAIIFGKIGGATNSFIGNDPISGTFISTIIGGTVLVIGSIIYLKKEIIDFLRKMFGRIKI